jgi:hypothetical protein
MQENPIIKVNKIEIKGEYFLILRKKRNNKNIIPKDAPSIPNSYIIFISGEKISIPMNPHITENTLKNRYCISLFEKKLLIA